MTANPLGSLSESADPASPPTVENLAKTGVLFPTESKNFALQYFVTSAVTSKYPCAPIKTNNSNYLLL